MSLQPSLNDKNGRTPNGRFAPGWKGGPGNPLAAKVNRLRARLLDTVTEGDVEDVIKQLIGMAKGGDIAAIRELLDRCLGKAQQTVDLSMTGRLTEVVEKIVNVESKNGHRD